METERKDGAVTFLRPLLISASNAFQRHPSTIADQLVVTLLELSNASPRGGASTVHACQALDGVLAPGRIADKPLLLEIGRVYRRLAWRAAGAGKVPEPAGSRLAVSEIIGPDGLIEHDRCRFGLFFQMSEVNYPAHSHEAEELYLVVDGAAEWAVDASPPQRFSCGSFSYIPSRCVHAIRTAKVPLLAFWVWAGDVGFDSYRMKNISAPFFAGEQIE